MVVKLVDTVVADGAVRGSWWTVPQAGLAKLHLHREAINDDVLGPTEPHPWGSPTAPVHRRSVGAKKLVSFRRRSRVPWHDSWVSGGCHGQEDKVLHLKPWFSFGLYWELDVLSLKLLDGHSFRYLG
jgi:hypothetical protein